MNRAAHLSNPQISRTAGKPFTVSEFDRKIRDLLAKTFSPLILRPGRSLPLPREAHSGPQSTSLLKDDPLPSPPALFKQQQARQSSPPPKKYRLASLPPSPAASAWVRKQNSANIQFIFTGPIKIELMGQGAPCSLLSSNCKSATLEAEGPLFDALPPRKKKKNRWPLPVFSPAAIGHTLHQRPAARPLRSSASPLRRPL